jgi:hypothetical protein
VFVKKKERLFRTIFEICRSWGLKINNQIFKSVENQTDTIVMSNFSQNKIPSWEFEKEVIRGETDTQRLTPNAIQFFLFI